MLLKCFLKTNAATEVDDDANHDNDADDTKFPRIIVLSELAGTHVPSLAAPAPKLVPWVLRNQDETADIDEVDEMCVNSQQNSQNRQKFAFFMLK